MKYLKFSIITPSFNQGRFIEENIQSVLAQNYPNFKHIVIDAGSTDNTVEILKKYSHLNWVSEPDRGQTHALNKGLKKATGDIVCWLNSDDLLCKEAFHAVNKFFTKNPNKSIVVGNLLTVGENRNLLWKKKSKKVTFDGLLNGTQCSQQPSTFHRKQVFEKIGVFDESYHYCMDHEFWIRAASKFEFYVIDVDLAMSRRYPGTKSTSNELGFIKELIRVKLKHKAKIISYGNARLLYSIIADPFRKIPALRRFIRKLKGKDPDYIYGGP